MRSTSTPPTSRRPSARSRSRRLGCAKNCKKNPAVVCTFCVSLCAPPRSSRHLHHGYLCSAVPERMDFLADSTRTSDRRFW